MFYSFFNHKRFKAAKKLKNNILKFYQKFKSRRGRRDEEQEDYPLPVNYLSVHQVLIEPIAAEDNYGSI